jgi:hypothetical protein
MAITATTISAAMTATQTTLTVASTTNITNPNFQTSAGITLLLIDQEWMLVTAVNTTTLIVNVQRGINGTASQAHVNGALVQSGSPTDFGTAPTEILLSLLASLETIGAQKTNAVFLSGSADALTGASAGFFVIKTAGVDAITLATPLAAHEGNVIQIFSDTANAHTITCPTTNFEVGATAKKTVCTFPAQIGAGITLRVCNLNYHVTGVGASGSTNAGVVVWT